MAKIYDIVNTSKMSCEYDGSLIFVQNRAKGALENGRLCAIDVDGTVRYAKDTDAKVYLHASVETMADTTLGLTAFRKEDGELVRLIGMRAGDEFATTAFSGAVVGDKVILDTDGKLKKATTIAGTENFVAEVVKVSTLGYDRTASIEVRVIKA